MLTPEREQQIRKALVSLAGQYEESAPYCTAMSELLAEIIRLRDQISSLEVKLKSAGEVLLATGDVGREALHEWTECIRGEREI